MFKDLKVIELATVLAGPSVGMFFSELGAEVLKIENRKNGGDVTRSWKLQSEDKTKKTSAYFSAVNYKKTYLDFDLKKELDYQEVIDLIKDADIVISNFKHSSAKKFKVDYDHIKSINPKIIFGQIDGFSNSDRVAFDVVLQAETGFMFMNGQKDSPPTKMPVALIDVLAAHQLKEGILVALIQKMKTNKGAFVSCSLQDAAISSLANQASNFLMENFIPQRIGSNHPNIAPYGEIMTTKDGVQLVLAAGSQPQFIQLCNALNANVILSNPKYLTNSDRVENRMQLAIDLQAKFSSYNSKDIYNTLIENNVPVGQIKNMKAVFDSDAAKDLILEEKIENENTKRVKTVVFKIKSAV